MKYLLSAELYYKNLERQEMTMMTPSREPKKDEIILYDKNSNSFSYWKVIRKCLTKYAFIVERHNVPSYWRNVIKIWN